MFNKVSNINPNVNEISSIGKYISEQDRQVANNVRVEIMDKLDKNSLAYKIISDPKINKYSEKQLQVITFEALKSKELSHNVSKSNESIRNLENAKKERESEKRKLKKKNKGAHQLPFWMTNKNK